MPITKSGAGSYSSGALSKLTDVPFENIRYFEKIGLLSEVRRGANGRREFGENHLKSLMFIRRARELGFSQDEVRELLLMSDVSSKRCADVKVIADNHLKDIQSKIAALQKMENLLATVSASCGKGQATHCPVIDVLFDENVNLQPT